MMIFNLSDKRKQKRNSKKKMIFKFHDVKEDKNGKSTLEIEYII